MVPTEYHHQLPTLEKLSLAKEFFLDEGECYFEAEPKERQVTEEYRKYYEENTPSTSKDEKDLDTSMHSTDTNLCSLPLMCICTIENMGRKSNTPEPLSLSQKHRRQEGDNILKEVMTWVSGGEKPRRHLLRGRPANLQAYWNIWEMLKIKDGVLYRIGWGGNPQKRPSSRD